PDVLVDGAVNVVAQDAAVLIEHAVRFGIVVVEGAPETPRVLFRARRGFRRLAKIQVTTRVARRLGFGRRGLLALILFFVLVLEVQLERIGLRGLRLAGVGIGQRLLALRRCAGRPERG